jgi:DnaT-like ssDNA binding protein
MAFVLEDGTGLINANAYTAVAFMRSYWTEVGTTFSQADGLLEVAIIKATRYVDNRFFDRWLGCREFPDAPQALAWPRLYVRQPDACIDYTGVPLPLQRAVAEYAQRALTGTILQPDQTNDPFVTHTNKEVGPLKTEENRIPGTFVFKSIPAADLMLKPLLLVGSYVYR